MHKLVASAAALLLGAAVVSFLLSGLAWTVGASTLRDRALRVALGCFAAGILLQVALGVAAALIANAARRLPDHHETPGALLIAALFGHVVLGVTLIARRLGGADPETRERNEERERTRERVRVGPHAEDER